MPRLLCLSTYPAEDASIRQRFLQYVPSLEEAGWEVRFESILGRSLFAIKNRGGLWSVPKAVLLAAGLVRRLAVLVLVPSFDCVWIQREAFPFHTPLAEKIVARLARGRVVLDFDDALHAYPAHPEGSFDWRAPLRDRSRFGEVVESAGRVIVGSNALATYAEAYNSSVSVVPTCVDTRRDRVPTLCPDGVTTIGWIGSWNTAQDLELLRDVLVRVAAKTPIRLLLVGSSNAAAYLPEGVEGQARLWRLDEEDAFFDAIDVGVMPLRDTPWNAGKCAYKLIQYASAGVPFVASPVGENVRIVAESQGGLLASADEEWLDHLVSLAERPDLRRAMGEAARSWAEQHVDYRLYLGTVLAAVRGDGE